MYKICWKISVAAFLYQVAWNMQVVLPATTSMFGVLASSKGVKSCSYGIVLSPTPSTRTITIFALLMMISDTLTFESSKPGGYRNQPLCLLISYKFQTKFSPIVLKFSIQDVDLKVSCNIVLEVSATEGLFSTIILDI